jgi:hypothetical protein
MSDIFNGKFGLLDYASALSKGPKELQAYKAKISDNSYKPIGPNVIFHRYVVLDALSSPNSLLGSSEQEYINKKKYWESLGVENLDKIRFLPRNTVIAKKINDVSASPIENPKFLLPFFPSHLSFPCKPGEHIWVIFESFKNSPQGYWICKITEAQHVDDVNHTHSPRLFESSFFPDKRDKISKKSVDYHFRVGRSVKNDKGEIITTSADTSLVLTDDESFYEKLLTESDAAQSMTYEPVPRFKKRPGDLALEGTNNTLIVLGTDRTGPYADIDSSEPEKGNFPKKNPLDMDGFAGSIDIVAGRGQTVQTGGNPVISKLIDGSSFISEIGKSTQEIVPNEGDPDWINDKSRVLVSQRTKVDTNLQINKLNEEFNIADSENGDASVLLKSDKIRILGRKDAQILVKDDAGSDISTFVIKSSGEITVKSKNTSIKIDDAGNVTIDAEGKVKIGDNSAQRGCARISDTITINFDSDSAFMQWLNEAFAAINSKIPFTTVPFGIPPTEIKGKITSSSQKVLIK